MGKKGKKKKKWPGMNHEVELPKQHIVYKASKDADLPEVLEKEIVSELDPRLGSDLPETSIYCNVGDFFEEAAEAELEAAARAEREALKPPSSPSSEEESWYKTDVRLPMGADLKVSVQGGAKGRDGNFPPAFPPQSYPSAMPFVPVIPQTIQKVPSRKDSDDESTPEKTRDTSAKTEAVDTAKNTVSEDIPKSGPAGVTKSKDESAKEVEVPQGEAKQQDSVKSGEDKEKKKAYGKRRGHKTVIPEDKVHSWITASEPFFQKDISPEPLPEPVMPLLVPKPVLTPNLLGSKSDTGSTSSDRRRRSKSPGKSSKSERHKSRSPTSSRDRARSNDKAEMPRSSGDDKREKEQDDDARSNASSERGKDGSDRVSITQEGILTTTEGGKLILPKELEESITEFLQKKFKMNFSDLKSKSDDQESVPKTALKAIGERRSPSPEVERTKVEDKRTITVSPAVATSAPSTAPAPVPPVAVPPAVPAPESCTESVPVPSAVHASVSTSKPSFPLRKSPARTTAQKSPAEKAHGSTSHVESSSKRQVLLPRALREKQKGSEPPAAPPVPPLPTRDRHHSPDKTSPQRRLPPPPDRKLPPPPSQRKLPPPPPIEKIGERTQQSVQEVFREFIKQEKELLGKENMKIDGGSQQPEDIGGTTRRPLRLSNITKDLARSAGVSLGASIDDMQNELSRGLEAVIAESGIRVKRDSHQKPARRKTGDMEDELRQTLNAAMEKAVSGIGVQSKPKSRDRADNDITDLQMGLSAQMDSIIEDSFRSESGKQPRKGWSSTSQPLYHFSKHARKALRAVCKKESSQVDDLVESKCNDIQLGLDSIYRGKDVDLDDLDLGEEFRHLPGLSLGTQLESTFAESAIVKRIHLETLRDWQKEKPLDMLLMGKLDLSTINPEKIRPSPKTDETVRQCMEEFREEIYKVMRGGDVATDTHGVFPTPRCQTEETVNQVHKQVSKYMDFLEEQARTTPYTPHPPGSKKKRKHKKRKKRKSRAADSDDEHSADKSAASSPDGSATDEDGEIKSSSAEEGELDNGSIDRRSRKRTKKTRRSSKDGSESDDESPEKKSRKHKKKKKHKDSARKKRKASQNKESSQLKSKHDEDMVSYSAVLAKRQRMLVEPQGVPPPQGVRPPSPFKPAAAVKSSTTNNSGSRKDEPPAAGMYSPTRPTDESRDKIVDEGSDGADVLTKARKLASRNRSSSRGRSSRDPRLDPARRITSAPIKPPTPSYPLEPKQPEKDPSSTVSHGAALNPYNVWWVVMKYLLEHEPDALEFLDDPWPELDRFQLNKEPQNSFLWSLAQVRHHRKLKTPGEPVKLPSYDNKESMEEVKRDTPLLEVDIPTATIEITGDENEYGSTSAVPTTPAGSVNADILSAAAKNESVEQEKKDIGKEVEEVTDSAADLLAKTKSAKTATKKSNALTLAFKQALMTKKVPKSHQAANHKELEKLLEKVTNVLNEKVRCDQNGDVSLMRDTDVQNPHLQALSFRAKGLLKMAKHNLMQIPGPSEISGFKPVPVTTTSVTTSSVPSNPSVLATLATTSQTSTVQTTQSVTTAAAKPKTTSADGSTVTFDRLQAAIKQHEEAIKKLEEERVANTAAALLAKIRKKSGPEDSEQPDEPGTEAAVAEAESKPLIADAAVPSPTSQVSSVGSVQDQNTPTSSVEQDISKNIPVAKKTSQVRKYLAKFKKSKLPQDPATQSTAAALLAKIKAKKTGGESPLSRPSRPSSTSSVESEPTKGQDGPVNEWPPTLAESRGSPVQTPVQAPVQAIVVPSVQTTSVPLVPMPPTEERPPPPPEEPDDAMEIEDDEKPPEQVNTNTPEAINAAATISARPTISAVPTIAAQPMPPEPPTSGAGSSISGAPVTYPMTAPPLPPSATDNSGLVSQTATSVAPSQPQTQQDWQQNQSGWFQQMAQNMDANQYQQWQQWATSHGHQLPVYQQHKPPDPSAWQKAFENLTQVAGEEKPAWWSGPWPPPHSQQSQQWPQSHTTQWNQQSGWGEGWQHQGAWGSNWYEHGQEYGEGQYDQYGQPYGDPHAMGHGMEEESYDEEPPPPGQENMPAFTSGMSGPPKPPPPVYRRGPPQPPQHIPSLLHDIDLAKPPPFIPKPIHDVPVERARGIPSKWDQPPPGHGRGRGNSPPSHMGNPWEARGRGRGGNSPPTPPSPWDAAKGGISIAKLKEITGGTSMEPEERVEPLGLNVKIYVLNSDAPACKSVEDFLQFNGIKRFDPFNLAALQHTIDPEAIVFIHNTHVDQIHRIPNLLELRQQPWVKFATFNDVFDIKHRTYKIMLKKGGCIVPDDTGLLSLNAETLDQIGTFMVQQREKLTPWSIKIHEHVMDRLRSFVMQKGEDKERFQVLLLLVEKFMRQGVVQILPAEKFPGGPRPPHQYHSTLQQLQIENCFNYRHFLLLSEVPCSDTRFQGILDDGFGIVDIASFMQLIIDKQAGRQVFVSNPAYGLKESDLFWDADLSSATDSLFKRDPSGGD